MSLKSFHVFFMSAAALLAAGFGVWCLRTPGYRVLAVPVLLVAVALPFYGVWFVRKMRSLQNGKAT